MNTSTEAIIFYMLLIDAISANIIAWPGNTWYRKHFTLLSRLFPLTRGWATLYLLLVLFIGYLIFYG